MHRQNHPERGFTGTAYNRQIAIVRPHNAVSNAKAQAGTWYLLLNRRTPVKPIKDPALFLEGNSFAMVGDLHHDRLALLADPDGHGGARRRVLQSIVQNL